MICGGRFGLVLLSTLLASESGKAFGRTVGSLLYSSVLINKLGLMSCWTERGGAVFYCTECVAPSGKVLMDQQVSGFGNNLAQ